MCPPGYLHNGFVATHALVHMMYSHYGHLALEDLSSLSPSLPPSLSPSLPPSLPPSLSLSLIPRHRSITRW